MPTAKDALPTTIMDNSLVTATRELGDQVRILRWRPGLGAIHEVEENSFYVGLNLKGKDFRGIDELNQYMKRLTAGGRPVPRIPPETPPEKAQALVYETIGAQRKKRIERCQQALAIYPGCADAWVILSEYEKDTDARREMLEQAVKAGEICLHDAGIDTDDSGRPVRSKRRSGSGGESEESLWGGSARPYMRARLALAQHLYQMVERDRAIKDYRDLLELNSHDNQGVRYLLVSALFELGVDAAANEAAAIVERISDASPMWAWAKVFAEYTKGGGACGSAVPATVTRAYYANPHVVGVLKGEVAIPKRLPESSEYGSEDEAVIYGSLAMGYWKASSGALQWLADAVDSITAGLPSPFGADAPSVKERLARLWRAGGVRGNPAPRDWYYAKALQDHPEFGEVWFTAGAFRGESFTVAGLSPFAHVGLQSAVENILDGVGVVNDSMRAAMNALTGAGLSRHEAVHLLGFVYAFDWIVAEGQASPIDVDGLIAHLRYLTRMGSGQIKPNAVLVTPERNDPCPCGSGRKYKKCCGRDDGWPIPPVVSFARAIKVGQGNVQSHRNLGLLSPVIGRGEYASVEELEDLPPGHPLVVLDNTSAVAEAMWEHGWQFHALWALQENISLARTLDDGDHLATALYAALNTLSQEDGYDSYVSQYASELARMTEDPHEASLLWSTAADAFMTEGKMAQAEEAVNRAVSTGSPHPGAKMVRARYLEQAGRPIEARAAYQEVVESCASSVGQEYEDMAEQAKAGIKRLERKARAAL